MSGSPLIQLSSDLQRKRWVKQGMLDSAASSFWTKYTSRATTSPVTIAMDKTANEAGKTVVFQAYAQLSGKAIRGSEIATGRGETKKVYSNKITIDRFRFVVDNGDRFNFIDTNDLRLSQHADSRQKLADLWIRWKDQMLFDTMAGMKTGEKPTHQIVFDTKAVTNTANDGQGRADKSVGDPLAYDADGLVYNHSFDYNAFLNLENLFKTSEKNFFGNTSGVSILYPKRRPLAPSRKTGSKPYWVLVVDTPVKNLLLRTAGFRDILQNADVRGNNNRLLDATIGTIGNVVIMEADHFFGEMSDDDYDFTESSVEIAGLRQYDVDSTDATETRSVLDDSATLPKVNKWSGQSTFSFSNKVYSRCLLLGQGAVQFAMGMSPDYHFQKSQDFGRTSESCLEVWCNAQKTRYNAETDDQNDGKLAGFDWGAVAVDVRVK